MGQKKTTAPKGGRPTDCTPEITAEFVKHTRVGVPLADAAALSGIHESTADRWMKLGKEGQEPYSGFYTAVTQARSAAKAEAIAKVRSGIYPTGAPDWKAEAWFLERTFPGEYGPQQVVAVKVEKELEAVVDRIESIRAKLGEDAYNLVCDTILGGCAAEAAGSKEG
jgi:hypothetical protein